MKHTFQNSTTSMAKYDFKVARIDIFDQDWYKQENFIMDELPYMVYYKKGELFTFPSIRDPPRMARMVERYNYFYQELKTLEEAENFMLKDFNYDNTGRLLTRPKSLAVIHDKEDYGDQLKNFQRIAKDFQWREDISLGLVQDKSVAVQLKNLYPQWFKTKSGNNLDSGNTVLVHRKKARHLEEFIEIYDLDERAGDYDDLHDFIGMGSLGIVEELTHLNRNAFHVEVPKMILFYNPIEIGKTEKAMDNFINNLAKKIGRRYNWLIADGRDNKRKMLSLGVNGCEMPCIGFEAPTPNNITYAYNNELLGDSNKNITMFLEKYEKGELFNIRQDIEEMWKGINHHEKIVENLTLTYTGLKNEVLEAGHASASLNQIRGNVTESNVQNTDFLLYLYNSTDFSESTRANLKTFAFVENFLQFRLYIDSMQVMAYDFGLNKLPVKFSRNPQFDSKDFFIYAKNDNSNGKVKREFNVFDEIDYENKIHALDLIHFALRNSSINVKIPKDFAVSKDEEAAGITMLGLMEGRDVQDQVREKEVIRSEDI